MEIKINIKNQVVNGIDLKNVLSLIAAQYVSDDGIAAYAIPEETSFGFCVDGKRVSAKNPAAVTVVEITNF